MDSSLIIYYAVGVFAIFFVTVVAWFVSARFNLKLNKVVLYLCVVFSLYMFVAQLLKYYSFHFYIDYSHWLQILYNIANTGLPNSANVEYMIPGSLNYFSIHFSPWLYLLAMPFKVWPHAETLIIMNVLIMLSSAIPLYLLAKKHIDDKKYGLFVAVLLILYPTFQYITLYEFGVLRLAIPLILWMLYFFETGRYKLYFLFVIFALLVREQIGLTIFMFGLYVTVFRKKYLVGVTTSLLGILAFVVIAQIIMPSLRGNQYQYVAMASFEHFGNSFGEIIINVLKNPLFAMKIIFNPIKLANVFMLFLPLVFVPLLAPQVLVSILANMGVGLLSESYTHLSYMLFYVSPSVPFIFYAFLKAWPKIMNILKKWAGSDSFSLVRERAMVAIFSGLMATNVFFGPSPISLQFWFDCVKPAPFRTQNFHHSVYEVTSHHEVAEEFCKLVPEESVVAAQHYFHSCLFKKKGTIMYPKVKSADGSVVAEYVLFDKTNNNLGEKSPAYMSGEEFDKIELDKGTWELIKEKDGIELYKRITAEK